MKTWQRFCRGNLLWHRSARFWHRTFGALLFPILAYMPYCVNKSEQTNKQTPEPLIKDQAKTGPAHCLAGFNLGTWLVVSDYGLIPNICNFTIKVASQQKKRKSILGSKITFLVFGVNFVRCSKHRVTHSLCAIGMSNLSKANEDRCNEVGKMC